MYSLLGRYKLNYIRLSDGVLVELQVRYTLCASGPRAVLGNSLCFASAWVDSESDADTHDFAKRFGASPTTRSLKTQCRVIHVFLSNFPTRFDASAEVFTSMLSVSITPITLHSSGATYKPRNPVHELCTVHTL